MLSIVSITLLIAALAVLPCLIATIKVSSKFGALGERFHKERIWLQVLKTLKEENNITDTRAKRKSRSEAGEPDQMAKFVTINSISIFVAILFHTWYSLFPAFTLSPL
jgi:hypothetical protein